MKYEEIIQIVAKKNHTTPAEVEAEMESALDAAQDSPNFIAIFGERKPTVEEIIQVIARDIISQWQIKYCRTGR